MFYQPILLDLANDTPCDIAGGQLAPGNSIRCGNRTDLPLKQRRHAYQELGPDIRKTSGHGFGPGIVFACQLCGADKFKRDGES
jgi:hypothetical protein